MRSCQGEESDYFISEKLFCLTHISGASPLPNDNDTPFYIAGGEGHPSWWPSLQHLRPCASPHFSFTASQIGLSSKIAISWERPVPGAKCPSSRGKLQGGGVMWDPGGQGKTGGAGAGGGAVAEEKTEQEQGRV